MNEFYVNYAELWLRNTFQLEDTNIIIVMDKIISIFVEDFTDLVYKLKKISE